MKLTTTAQVSVDGVMQGPGGREEDERGRFKRGGWAHFDDEASTVMDEIYQRADAFLFGRRTYEIFAGSWGSWADSGDSPIWTALNTLPKHVASTTLTDPGWANTTVLSGDVAAAVGELKAKPGRKVQVHGSGALFRWLLDNDLVDEMNLFIFPVVVGQGTRLFPDSGPDTALDLVDSRVTLKEVSRVTRPRPQLLDLARRLRHRRTSEPRRTVRPRRRKTARMDVHDPVVARDGRRARRHPRPRRRLRAAARARDRRRDHGCREVRLPRMARGPGVEGVVGSRPAVPHTGLRPHPSPAPVDRDGGRHDVPLPRRVARRGARDRSGGRGRAGRAPRWRRHRDPRLPRCGACRPHAHRGGPDFARPRRAPVGGAGGPREGLSGRGRLLAQRSDACDVHACGVSPLGRALTRQPDGVNPTILDDPLDAQGGTSCRNCSWTSSPRWTATGPRRAGPDGGDSKDPSISPGSASSRNATTRS